jgi:hypothetical protein
MTTVVRFVAGWSHGDFKQLAFVVMGPCVRRDDKWING